MKLSQPIQMYALLAGIASAFPNPSALTETIMLSNGTMTVAVEVEASEGLDERAILGRSSVDCKGSSRAPTVRGSRINVETPIPKLKTPPIPPEERELNKAH